MNININGRTPEEIKKGLECCALGECDNGCPYFEKMLKCTDKNMDALTLINQLLEDNQQLERERDAAVEYLAVTRYCMTCIYDNVLKCDKCKGCFMTTTRPNWQWRGVQESNYEQTLER